MTTVGSLCSGYGGIELALSSVLDCDLAWFAEFETRPRKSWLTTTPACRTCAT